MKVEVAFFGHFRKTKQSQYKLHEILTKFSNDFTYCV